MALVARGMVQVDGTTYRIVRTKRGHYNVMRVLDDVQVGTFSTGTSIQMRPEGITSELMQEIVRVAVQGAKTSWIGRID
jgi:hypothetical protein